VIEIDCNPFLEPKLGLIESSCCLKKVDYVNQGKHKFSKCICTSTVICVTFISRSVAHMARLFRNQIQMDEFLLEFDLRLKTRSEGPSTPLVLIGDNYFEG
jgi:hypothetical protein